jgi:S1-C subfamily serine protease
MKNTRLLLILLMLFGTLALLASAVLVLALPGAPLSKFFQSDQDRKALRLYVQAPPLAELGDEFGMIATLTNTGPDFIQIDELRLPQELLDAAIVMGIFPGALSPTPYELEAQVGYPVDFLLGPGERVDIEIRLLPRKNADLISLVQVRAGEQVVESGVRMAFDRGITPEPSPTATLPPTATPTAMPTATATQPNLAPYQAVVQIFTRYNRGSSPDTASTGSGTIITPDGLILTNHHVVIATGGMDSYDDVVVALSFAPDKPPEEMYRATVIDSDSDLDIALIRIFEDMDGNPVDHATLNLPYIPLGNSDGLALGQELAILGYPAIGGDTITYATGEVSGFTASRKYGDRAYIKTTASVTGGTSGGAALDLNGYLVAIPTRLGYGGRDILVDCRPLVDTNGDGDITGKDSCVPLGGFINAMRPINLALPMIEEAILRSGSPLQITPIVTITLIPSSTPTPTP